MKKIIFVLVMILAAIKTSGCRIRPQQPEPAYDAQLAPGQQALRKISNPYAVPDFTLACADTAGLRTAAEHSLNYLQRPSSRRHFPCCGITHEHAAASLKAFVKLLDAKLSASELNREITGKFDVYMSVGYDNNGTVLFTGYYTPIFDGSPVRTNSFPYPLYKPPANLVKGPDGQILGLRRPDGQLVPCPPRAEIEKSGQFTGNELVWLGDAFEVYLCHVQGSAKVRMPDGEIVTIGYAASNGHEYRSVGEELIKDGKITVDQMSLTSMMDYFAKHKEQIDTYIQRNPRYIFFRKEGSAAHGSINVPVTAMRTIAADKSIFPRAGVVLVRTELPVLKNGKVVNRFYSGFALDQDTGGAIRAAGRCDIYMGVGETAGKLAGHTRQKGNLYYLFLKPDLIGAAD